MVACKRKLAMTADKGPLVGVRPRVGLQVVQACKDLVTAVECTWVRRGSLWNRRCRVLCARSSCPSPLVNMWGWRRCHHRWFRLDRLLCGAKLRSLCWELSQRWSEKAPIRYSEYATVGDQCVKGLLDNAGIVPRVWYPFDLCLSCCLVHLECQSLVSARFR